MNTTRWLQAIGVMALLALLSVDAYVSDRTWNERNNEDVPNEQTSQMSDGPSEEQRILAQTMPLLEQLPEPYESMNVLLQEAATDPSRFESETWHASLQQAMKGVRSISDDLETIGTPSEDEELCLLARDVREIGIELNTYVDEVERGVMNERFETIEEALERSTPTLEHIQQLLERTYD